MGKRNGYATAYGYGASIIAQTIGQPTLYEDFGLAQEGAGLSHTNTVTGMMNGPFSTGGALGALFTAWTAHAFVRLRTIQLACVVCIVGASLMTGSINVAMFQASRFIMGWGIRMMACGVPLYQSEIATPTHRGRHVGFHGMELATGYTMTGFIGLVLSNGCKEYAGRNLRRLHADPTDPSGSFAHKEFYQMTQQFLLEQQRRSELGVQHCVQAHGRDNPTFGSWPVTSTS
ncbi:and other transporter-domain-containing protein [Clohesyomyces aquaticus]|uniref:And other transporter-domain-containing protein n=1 Tax=Clohesyomyces aquaticus TaxID=1231657 RepID=A0A1Y1Z9T6_9PLEO|nr:and other transporter-domain-containing protein [Clohesyomyces aquaticus]